MRFGHVIVTAVDCHCEELHEVSGDEARRYAGEHLDVLERTDAAEWVRDHMMTGWHSPWVEDYAASEEGHGWGECRCPKTGWRWHATWSPQEYRLVRRPFTQPEDYLDHILVARRAEEVARTHAAVNEAFGRRDRSEEAWRAWEATTEAAHTARESLYSPDWYDLLRALQRGDQGALEPALVFLEVDPWCFRSGYQKECLLRYLSRMPLPEEAASRLRSVLINTIVKGWRREFPFTVRVARAIRTSEFENALRTLSEQLQDKPWNGAAALLDALATEGRRGTGQATQ